MHRSISAFKPQSALTPQSRTYFPAEQLLLLMGDYPELFPDDAESEQALADHFLAGLSAAVEIHGDALRSLLLPILCGRRAVP